MSRSVTRPGGTAARSRRSKLCRVLLAESYPILLDGLRNMFSAEAGFVVAACCATGAEVLQAAVERRPDVLVLDYEIARENAFDLLQSVISHRPACRIVLLADHIGEDEVAHVIRMGAKDVVLKRASADDLLQRVRNVHAGIGCVDPVADQRSLDRALIRISPRQLQIARLVAGGHTNAEVAHRLAITEGTVKAHLHVLYTKLRIKGRLELALYATRALPHPRPRRPAA